MIHIQMYYIPAAVPYHTCTPVHGLVCDGGEAERWAHDLAIGQLAGYRSEPFQPFNNKQ